MAQLDLGITIAEVDISFTENGIGDIVFLFARIEALQIKSVGMPVRRFAHNLRRESIFLIFSLTTY
jgi:hypothetical protein